MPTPEPGEIKLIPSNFQRRTLWGAITGLSITLIGVITVGMVILCATVLSYLQPILVPLAVAGIIAYLLDPIVAWLQKRGMSHRGSTLAVYVLFILFVILLIVAVFVPTFGQAQEAYGKRDAYSDQVTKLVKKSVASLQGRFAPGVAEDYYQKGIEWIADEGPKIGADIGQWLWSRVRGAFGILGYLLGLLLVPIYLYYFLQNGHVIASNWSNYLPLKASHFKNEVVATLTEINGYLISFFRGQMVVSLIDGALVAVALSILGLPYALLIGVFLAILGLIPYIGNLLVMVPAILIAIAHFGATSWGTVQGEVVPVVGQVATVIVDDGTSAAPAAAGQAKPRKAKSYLVTTVSADGKRAEVMENAWKWLPNMWAYPAIVLLIFVTLQQINGLVTAPRIVGDSVGLHPLTVIFSVLFWSFLLGGLLGALLAVPLTAALKVLFRRYLWERRFEAVVGRRFPTPSDGTPEVIHAAGDGEDIIPVP